MTDLRLLAARDQLDGALQRLPSARAIRQNLAIAAHGGKPSIDLDAYDDAIVKIKRVADGLAPRRKEASD